MKKMYKYFLLSLTLVSFGYANAQKPITPLERRIIEKALDNFEMYKSCITVADDETRSYFLDLFKDKKVPVYNDLLGISSKSDINISDYLEEQKANVVSPIIRIRNVNRDKIWEEDGKWKVQLSFDKSLSYQNPCGIYFNTEDFYGKMFRESMILSYDEINQTCCIESITGKIDSDRNLPDDYCILDSTNVKDNRVIYRHRDGKSERVNFNNFGQMLLTSGYEKNQFYYPDNDVMLKTHYKPECHLMTLSYTTHQWRLKAYYDIGLGNSLTLGDNSFYTESSSKSSSFGIDAGYVFPSEHKIKIGVFMGLGLSNYSLDLSKQTESYVFKAKDIDEDDYMRNYENINMAQTTKIKEFSIPIYADFDWRFSKWASFYVDLGLKLNMNISNSVGEFNGSVGEVYGVYSQYGNLRLDESWGFEGFTTGLKLTQDNLCDDGNISVKKFAPDLMLGAGFRVNIPRTPLALDFGIGYQKGFGDLISVSEKPVNQDKEGNVAPQIIYITSNANDQISPEEQSVQEHVHNLIEHAGSVSRGMLKFNLGLIYKF